MARITRKFIEARLETTTKNMRDVGMLALTDSIRVESTGSDRYPWRLYILRVEVDGPRYIPGHLTSNVTWHGVTAAVDALYEASWHARSLRDAVVPVPVESQELDAEDIPEDWPVQPDDDGDTTCGTCGLSWDDDASTSLTPVPSGRCPFESFHHDAD